MLLCNYLLRFHQVTALCFEEAYPGEYAYECPVIRLPISTGNNIMRKTLAGIKRIWAIKKIKQQLRPDVSIAFGNTAIILNVLSGKGEKKIAAIRQSFSIIIKDAAFKMKLHLRLYVWALKKSDKIVSVSKSINDELKKYFNISNELFINNGIDLEVINNLSGEAVEGMPEGRQWIVHSGRFDRSKGHWHLVKIFAQIKNKLPDTGLILLGAKDTSSATGAAIENYCKLYLTQQNISWSDDIYSDADVLLLGHQANPFKFIKKATLFVFPSLWEGFPNALIEAMGCKVTVVAANCETGPKEILMENKEMFGLLLPAFTDIFIAFQNDITALEDEWANTITELLNDKKQMEYYSTQSAKRSKKYSIENTGSQWRQLLEEIKK